VTTTPRTRTGAVALRRPSAWAAGLLGLLALVILTMTVRSAAAGPSAAAAKAEDAKPTVVLVHGAWADSSSWSKVVRRLQQDGYTVAVPPNPLRGLTGDSAYLASYLNTISGPVVLVGHSYGGAVITNAATGDSDVKALVYIDAFAPDEGETVVQLATAEPGSAIGGDPETVFDAVPIPGAPGGDVDLCVKKSVFPDAFANDLPRKTAAVLAAVQRPVAFSALVTPSGAPAWETIPSWYFVGTRDRVLPPAEQRFMAERADANTVEVKASHLPMVSRPGAVTKLIMEAAEVVD
jgi:pimeloyl-ACP methyl ester carboxylesterase